LKKKIGVYQRFVLKYLFFLSQFIWRIRQKILNISW
jgi:hypothetical protein